MNIPLAHSGLRPQDLAAAITVLNSGQLTMGKCVAEFESAMAEYLKMKHFVMVNSGSSANLAIFEALLRPAIGEGKLKVGDGVLVPAIAWPTTIWPIIQLGLKPVFVDVEPNSLALDLEDAQRVYKSCLDKPKAIFPIHPLGAALNSEKYNDFCNANNLLLVQDVCESLGSWTNSGHAGNNGLASSFSFYFSHHITTMEGGGIATNDNDLANDLRSVRSHGWSRNRSDARNWTSKVDANDERFLFVSSGYNLRPLEIEAAIGLSQLRDLDDFIIRRRQIALRVHEVLRPLSLELVGSSSLISEKDAKSNSWMLLPIRIHSDTLENTINIKTKLIESLNASGVETRPPLTGNFLQQPGLKKVLDEEINIERFLNANLLSASTFLIGCHPDLSDSQVNYLCEVLGRTAKRLM